MNDAIAHLQNIEGFPTETPGKKTSPVVRVIAYGIAAFFFVNVLLILVSVLIR